jgi:hypothetical protein
MVYDERVVVVAPPGERTIRESAAESVLSGADVRTRTSVLASDVLTALHSVPRVAATSDFRTDFSVRGSAPRHVAVVIDEVAAPMLRHGAYGIGESATLTMINPDAIDRAALQVGAYPRRFADALGGQVGLTIREGSRTRTAFSGAVGGIAAAVVAEGPIGHDGGVGAAGSWLLSMRQSFLDWPTTSFAAEYSGTAFGFRDLQAKAVYDVSESQRGSVTVVAGQSVADNGDAVGAAGFFQGQHGAALVIAGWRSALPKRIVLQQRAYFVAQSIRNTDPTGATLWRSHQRGLGYRADAARTWRALTVEGGGQLEQRAERAGYVTAKWVVTPSLTLLQGARMAGAAWTSRIATSPWITAEWKTVSGWTVAGAVGAGHQFFENYAAPESARYVDVSIERPIAPALLVQATWFGRTERDVIDPLFKHTTLSSNAHGVELAFHLLRFGSLAYSYGRTRSESQTDGPFWGDFDQRHQINAFASYTLARTTISASFRGGTNFPIAGYFAARSSALVVGDRRNALRRPGYARLDARVSRPFRFGGHEAVLVGEILNVLNRTNFAASNGSIDANGQAFGFSEKLLPRFATAGLRIAF